MKFSALFVAFAAVCACALAAKFFTPVDLHCKYHLTYFWEDELGRWNKVHEYGLHTKNTEFYIYEVGVNMYNESEEFYHGTRSYERKGPEEDTYMSLYTYPNGTCQEEEESGYTSYDPFEYVTGPEETPCPDGTSTGCTKYINSTGYEVIVDKFGRYVRDYLEFNFTYYDDVSDFPFDKFATTCGSIVIETPTDICAGKRTFKSKELPCKYHLSYFWDDEEGRPNKVHEYGMHIGDTKFYIYEIGFNKSDDSQEFYHGTRSNERLAQGSKDIYVSIYSYPNNTCILANEGYPYFDDFDYETGPNTIPCPDGKSEGCEVYWNSKYEHIIVNHQGYYVKDLEYEYTYYDDAFISLSKFEIECEDFAIKTPKDLCAAPASGSASAAYVSLALMVLAAVALLL